MRLLLDKLSKLLVVAAILLVPCLSLAKDSDDQTQIILLNDSAAALEDSNPGLSSHLTQFADEREKEWEEKTANKDVLPTPITDSDLGHFKDQVELLKEAARAIQPTYPLIAQALRKMAHDLNKKIEVLES